MFDTSPETFCRNEPNVIQGSPCEQLEAIWKVEPLMPDMDQQWDDIAAWMGSHMGERDHRLEYPKFYAYSLARKTGISAFTARPKIRNALKAIFPEFRQGEWEMPWWIGSQTELERSYAVFKINRSSRIAVWLIKNRPQIPVIHIVRHPGGRLNSWLNRFLSTRDAEAIDQRNKARLKQVLEIAPEWKDLIGDIDTMSIVESETWFWRYVTETIHRAGEGAKNYKLIIYEHLALYFSPD
jgi:hypothetical protein